MDQVEEVKRKVNIVDVISEHVQLRRAGRNLTANCPFHSEKTPSFIVSPEIQIYKCFGCGNGGDVFKFLMEYEKIDFPQALKILADRVGVKLKPIRGSDSYQEKEEICRVNYITSEFYHYLLTSHKIGQKALEYLKKRGVSEESIRLFSLGYSPDKSDATFRFLTEKRGYTPELLEKAGIIGKKQNQYYDRFWGRVIFPLKDHLGNVVGLAGRIIEDRDAAKYINTPETLVYKKGRLLFGLEVSKQDIKKSDFAVVVEGELDFISSWQIGIKNVVAIKGTALTEDQVALLGRFCSKIVLCLDADFAGDQAARRGIEIAQKEGLDVRIADLGDFKDPDQMAKKDSDGLKKAIENAKSIYQFLIDLAFEKFANLSDGNAKISREIVPVLASIDDDIVKAHYVKLVAERLKLPQEAVIRQTEKIAIKKPQETQKDAVVSKKTRRHLLEERLLSIFFQSEFDLLDIISFIKTPVLQRLLLEVRKSWDNKKYMDLVSVLPQELIDTFAGLVMCELGLNLNNSQEVKQEVDTIKRSLETLEARERISELTEKIRTLEGQEKTEEIQVVESELAKEAEKLARLE